MSGATATVRGAVAPGAILVCILSALLHPKAKAEDLAPRGDAAVMAKGRWQSGVFQPARLGVADDAEIVAHPLLFFVLPHVELRIKHVDRSGWTITGEYGLAFPSLALRVAQGYLVPSFEKGQGRIGWHLQPSLGAVASHPIGRGVLSLKADASIGIPLRAGDLRPADTLAPIDMMLWPVLNHYRVRVGALWDAPIAGRWRWRLYGDAFVHGTEDRIQTRASDSFAFRVGGGADMALGSRGRLVLGFAAWNHFQHARDGGGYKTRSTDVFPVADFIWSQ